MQRRAFQLRIREDRAGEYDEIHCHVWPDLLAELQGFGVRDYSIFRRGQELFLYLRVPDFDALLGKLATSAMNRRWQRRMAPLFKPVPSLNPGEDFAMMEEVFSCQEQKQSNSYFGEGECRANIGNSV
jgi:L-rhamnose mutarotase